MRRRKIGGLAVYQDRFDYIARQLKRMLDDMGEPPINFPTYSNFVKVSCKRLSRAEGADRDKIIEKLIEEWSRRKGANKKVLKRIAKLLPVWCELLYK